MQVIEKPWGREIWVAVTDAYALKIIHFHAGARSSLQYHQRKHEHVYIDSGRVRAELADEHGRLCEYILEPGAVIENPPGRRHRIEALEDTRLIEVSTPHLDDVVRVADDYNRAGTDTV